ncbi:MAG TPA: glycosyltransferase family 4 protein [Acidobacteriota bacterium]|nr:glycosyltransferase family 4 protein [Acidobacteriota bacterium]
MRLASLCIPHVGGTYIFSENLRRSLASEGIELRWIAVGKREQEAVEDFRFAGERAFGKVIGVDAVSTRDQAYELIKHLRDEGYEAVIIHVLAGQLQANIARYLPAGIMRILIVHNITRGTYSYARAIRDHVHAAVAPSPRIHRDLVARCRFPTDRCVEIMHGIEVQRFDAGQTRKRGNELKILSLGRIEHQSKGVFWIPEILKRLNVLNMRVTIVGDGPDLGELKRRMLRVQYPVEFAGAVPNESVPDFYRQHDLLLMPSHYEGFPLVLIEAMAAGCVPAVSKIQLVTDCVVDPGVTGWLFDPGDVDGAAAILRKAEGDRERLLTMSDACRKKAATCYSLSRMGRSYAALIRSLVEDRPAIAQPLPLSDWRLPAGIRPGVTNLLPSTVKPMLRRWRECLFYRW